METKMNIGKSVDNDNEACTHRHFKTVLETNSWYSKHDYVSEFVEKKHMNIHILLGYLGDISTSASRLMILKRSLFVQIAIYPEH